MSITNIVSRTSLILLFLTMTSVFVQAQDDIQQAKIAFFTEKLELSTAEAEKFWPVYNEYQAAKKTIKEKYQDNPGPEKMEEESTLLKKYNAKYKEILPATKVAKLYKAEEEFKKILLDILKGR